MSPIIKHLYQRTITQNGKKVKVWYFWYYDKSGKQVRKSCGTPGNPCLLKYKAQEYIESLKDEDLFGRGRNSHVRDYVSGLYDTDSQFIKRRTAKGFENVDVTRRQKVHRLNLFIEKFGDMKPEFLSMVDIEDWLLEFKYSNSWRNSMLITIKDIFRVLYEQDAISKIPVISGFKKKKKSTKDILTEAEIKLLFPDNDDDIRRIWCAKNDSFLTGYLFYAMCFCIMASGMRSGEARAIEYSQFIKKDTVFLNAAYDSENERIDGLKKHTDEDKKWRIVILPMRAVNILERLKKMNQAKETDLVFELNGKYISKERLLSRMKRALIMAGIDTTDRELTVHSLRFTYNTIMKRKIEGDDLRLFMGHTSESMTEYYDRSTVLDNLPELEKNRQTINDIWN